MKHRPFEDWLFADDQMDDILPSRDTAALEEHLQSCSSCRDLAGAWRGVESQLRMAPSVAPRPGFASRWQARLEAEHKRLERRQSLAVLGFNLTGAALLFGSLALLALPALESPRVLLWAWLYQFLQLLSYVFVAQDLLSTLIKGLASGIPLVGWVFLAGMICELAVLWVVSFRLLTKPRRITI